ncbi:MAG: 2,3-bisphosphoglycerate-independent phosphoglycerate mutase [Ignavibacteria bacterium]|jgi:2,3-bisphosphoglycerate-independent phosphoglycerate mutase|nr:2,3-bisphosphoglycerate-independent phosphoglycerate mutase [Ignavibacteria bacterium]
MQKKFLLMILDGWGIGDKKADDLIYNGNTTYFKHLLKTYPNSQLMACGEDVGLPDGQMGNSEVGHLNIGAGRVIYQDLVKINIECRENKIQHNKNLVDAMEYAKTNGKAIHFIGLVSDGGVHSSEKHLYKLCEITKDYNLQNVFIHALMDGRDTDPRSGENFMQQLVDNIKPTNAQVASVCGRYYTMDRDKRWERVKQGYDLMVNGVGIKEINPVTAIKNSYANEITDEFIKPTVIVKDDKPIGVIKPDDVVICFNFRKDRLREITTVLTQQDMPEFDMHTIPLHYYTMTPYDEHFKNVYPLYREDEIVNTIGQVISNNGLKQLRIAETEKYAHVTFFTNGGREDVFDGEERILINSPKVATYDLQPEMSAYLVRDALLAELNKKKFDLVILNFANGDMVGHTGVKDAILQAVEVIDNCVKSVVETALSNDYDVLLIADHGNADHAINDDGSPNTAHSLNPVPCIFISNDKKYNNVKNGRLADVAPTILTDMNIKIPAEMTGNCLLS